MIVWNPAPTTHTNSTYGWVITGSCLPGRTYQVRFKVTDSSGAYDIAYTSYYCSR